MPLSNDGSIPYGSLVLTINNVTYVAEQIEVRRPTFIIERRNQLNQRSGQVIDDDFVTGTATLQLATGATAIPTNGMTFSTTFEAAAETFIVSEVGQPEEQAGKRKPAFLSARN